LSPLDAQIFSCCVIGPRNANHERRDGAEEESNGNNPLCGHEALLCEGAYSKSNQPSPCPGHNVALTIFAAVFHGGAFIVGLFIDSAADAGTALQAGYPGNG
jgi:hypothetical protein